VSPAFIETVGCHWCGQFKPRFRVHTLASRQTICDYCLEWHYHALEFLGGAAPAGCQVCLTSWAELRAAEPGDEVRLYVVPKDGILALLCRACVKPYLPKTKDHYKGTRFGAEALKIL
jgi:hypothetical protein